MLLADGPRVLPRSDPFRSFERQARPRPCARRKYPTASGNHWRQYGIVRQARRPERSVRTRARDDERASHLSLNRFLDVACQRDLGARPPPDGAAERTKMAPRAGRALNAARRPDPRLRRLRGRRPGLAPHWLALRSRLSVGPSPTICGTTETMRPVIARTQSTATIVPRNRLRNPPQSDRSVDPVAATFRPQPSERRPAAG